MSGQLRAHESASAMSPTARRGAIVFRPLNDQTYCADTLTVILCRYIVIYCDLSYRSHPSIYFGERAPRVPVYTYIYSLSIKDRCSPIPGITVYVRLASHGSTLLEAFPPRRRIVDGLEPTALPGRFAPPELRTLSRERLQGAQLHPLRQGLGGGPSGANSRGHGHP